MRLRFLAIALGMVLLVAGNTLERQGISFKAIVVSLPPLKLEASESVDAVDCTVRGGMILRLNPPYLWYLTLDNGSAGSAELHLHAIVGAAALTRDRLQYFDNFLTVGKIQHTEPFGSYFDVEVVLSITDSDTDTSRKLPFKLRDLKMTPTAASPGWAVAWRR